MSKDLIIKIDITPEKVFVAGGLTPVIEEIKKKVAEFKADISTAKGREELKKFVKKIPKSKTFIDNIGKELKADYKAKIDPIDAERKRFRDIMDELRDDKIKPLVEWEAEQERIAKEEQDKERFLRDWDEAILEDDFFNRERELKRKEEEIRAKEEAARAKEEEARRIEEEKRQAEEAAQRQREFEEKAKREADERAKAEAEEKIRQAEYVKRKAIEEKQAAEEKAKRDAEEALRRAEAEKQAEIDRLMREIEAEERAEAERISKEKAEEERRKADIEHRKKINNLALDSFVKIGIESETARRAIEAIAKGQIPNITINY